MYSGFLPFADPQEIDHGIKGHMVRPHGVHLANKVCFTLGGGERTYNLGQFLISADWVAQAPAKLVKSVLQPQLDFYQSLVPTPLQAVFQTEGILGKEVASENQAVLEKLGFLGK